MKKTYIFTIVLILVFVIGGVFYRMTYVPNVPNQNQNATSTEVVKSDMYRAIYTINEEEVVLENGKAETWIPGGATTTTTYFGNDVQADFDSDGIQDTAFIVTQNGGGSGTFYYLVAVLNKKDGSQVGTYGFFLGDRIAPQTNAIEAPNTVVVNYADRNASDSFVVAPSVAKSVYLKFNKLTNQFEKVIPANVKPAAPTVTINLKGKTWAWVKTTYSDGKTVVPSRADRFKLTFTDKGFSASTDCNGVGGEYVIKGNQITFDRMMSTLMYCEDSQEGEFSKMLSEVKSYHISSNGELVFDLKVDSGIMVFK